MEAGVAEKTESKEFYAAGMAWIEGKQKPFYNPRVIKKGKNKGKIKACYLRSPGHYRTVILSHYSITKILPGWKDTLGKSEA